MNPILDLKQALILNSSLTLHPILTPNSRQTLNPILNLNSILNLNDYIDSDPHTINPDLAPDSESDDKGKTSSDLEFGPDLKPHSDAGFTHGVEVNAL